MLQDFRLRVMARTGHYYKTATGAKTACRRQVARLRGSPLSCDQYLGRLFGLYDVDRCWVYFDSLAPPWAMAFCAKMIPVLEDKPDFEDHPAEVIERHAVDVMEILYGVRPRMDIWAAGVEAGIIVPWELIILGVAPKFVGPRLSREWAELTEWAEKNRVVLREFCRHPRIFRLRAKIMNFNCRRAISRSRRSTCTSGARSSTSSVM